MLTRFLTALVLAPAVLVVIYFGDIPFLILVLIAAILTLQEVFMMLYENQYAPNVFLGYAILSALIFSSFAIETYFYWNHLFVLVLVGILFLLFFVELYRKKLFVTQNNLLLTFRTALVLGILFSFFILMRNTENGLVNLLFCFLLTWSSDSAALLGGKWFGKHALAPHISPNKTIEGALFGILGAFVASILFCIIFKVNPYLYGPLSIVVSVIGQIGDLHESLTKRFFNVKNSSNLLPGHGGIYDRLDSSLFVFPVMYYIFLFS